jgi:hypothetical protein
MPPWLAEPLPAIKAEAIRLYSMNSKVLGALTVDYSQIVLKALGVRRAPFVAMPLFLPRPRTPAGGGGSNPSLACAGATVHGQEQACGDGEAAV